MGCRYNSCRVVNCFKMCIFALARTTLHLLMVANCRCELLQNVYLCISTYNTNARRISTALVVNCFKMCIFALARTTHAWMFRCWTRCELLQNVYLCISTYNNRTIFFIFVYVVNCFKMCIFALARTTLHLVRLLLMSLWIASKCVSLH